MHLPVEAQRPSTSIGLHRTAFFSASKVDGHWIMLHHVPPTDPQRLWGEWRSGLAWTLDAGLLRDDWRVCKSLIDSDFEL